MEATEIRSLETLLGAALTHERHAAGAFEAAAQRMHAAGRDRVAGLFRSLSEQEHGHARELEALAGAYGVDPARIGAVAAVPQHNWADDVLVAGATLYDCLAEAVRSEERAFRFYAYVAANAEDARTRELAERLAREELNHAAGFRRARRQAYREGRRRRFWPAPSAFFTASRLLAEALPREAALAGAMARHAALLPGLAAAGAAAKRTLDERVAGLPAPLRPDWAACDPDGLALAHASGPADTVAAALSDASEAFDFYDAVVDRTAGDEASLTLAQDLSAMATVRVAAITRLRAPDSEPAPAGA